MQASKCVWALGAASARQTEELGLLPMRVLYSDGGAYSAQYSVDNLLRDDGTVYSTSPHRKEDVNVVLGYAGPGRSFSLTSATLVAPTEGFTSPLQAALLCVSWDYPDLSCPGLAACCGVSSQEEFAELAEAWQEGLSHHDHPHYHHLLGPPGPPRGSTPCPVAYVELGEGRGSRRSVTLETPRSGRYVLLKMLRSRGRVGEGCDVTHLGLRGWGGPTAFGSAALL